VRTLLEYLSAVMPDETVLVRCTPTTLTLLLSQRDALRFMDVAPYPPDSPRAPYTLVGKVIETTYDGADRCVWFATREGRGYYVGWVD
jgi:hypothetical protein